MIDQARGWLIVAALLAAGEAAQSENLSDLSDLAHQIELADPAKSTQMTDSASILPASASILHVDPFEKPELLPRARPTAPEEQVETPKPTPWTPELRAIVAALDRSLVNLDGFVLEVGESYQGFRLVEVTERGAVFRNAEQERVLSFDD